MCLVIMSSFSQAQVYSGVQYGPAPRQYLDIYIAPSNCPTPVYFDAHSNNGTTAMPSNITDSLTSNGISVVSWESIPTINSAADLQTGWNDAGIMFSWIKANASTYNFDTTNFIIGGSSRGTVLSWKEAHRIDPDIKGLYMYNALPSGAWVDSTLWYPPNDVSSQSPPIFFVYNREPGCSADTINPDIHDPNYGITIQGRYNDLGIGDRDTLIHSIGVSANTDRYQYLLEFALSIIDPCASVGITTESSDFEQINAFPNPFSNEFNISGLKGNEKFTLLNAVGQILIYHERLDQIDLSYLNAGIYFLSIESDNIKKTIQLIKE